MKERRRSRYTSTEEIAAECTPTLFRRRNPLLAKIDVPVAKTGGNSKSKGTSEKWQKIRKKLKIVKNDANEKDFEANENDVDVGDKAKYGTFWPKMAFFNESHSAAHTPSTIFLKIKTGP